MFLGRGGLEFYTSHREIRDSSEAEADRLTVRVI